MTVTLVAAVARNGVIGADGGIPWHLPGEQRRFKELTVGHVLVMGRLTYESIGRPLPGRTTVVVTGRPGWRPGAAGPSQGGSGEVGSVDTARADVAAGAVRVASGVEEALQAAGELDDEVYVVGGERVYAEALPFADRLALTWVDAEPAGDAYFPHVEWTQWQETAREPHDGWELVTYERRN